MDVMNTQPATAASAKTDQTKTLTSATGDFETFLKLLTTQMKNQDPLKPLESTEFVAQLANFSAVEQQVNTNKSLDAILAELSLGAQVGAADWIGKEVRADTRADWRGETINIRYDTHATADGAQMVVRDASGNVVHKEAVSPTANEINWGGTADLPLGEYSFAVESYEGEELLETSPGLVYATVEEVSVEDGRMILGLSGGGEIAQSEVTQIRRARR
ncbi:flagellar hook capping FlgD N-terminal domain-containing protein [Paracoccaceae bacterium GXU_MW_L88]